MPDTSPLHRIEEKKQLYLYVRDKLSDIEETNFDEHFTSEYTHDSTAIEGNTVSLIGTKMILEDRIIPEETTEREYLEIKNHADAWAFVKECAEQGLPVTEERIKDIHERILARPGTDGIYRTIPVYINSAQHVPPSPEKVWNLMGNLAYRLEKDAFAGGIEKAAFAHAELVRIHPFADGNGRTAHLLMNYFLLADGFPPTTIKKGSVETYFSALEEYSLHLDLVPFARLLESLVETSLDSFLRMYHCHLNLDEIASSLPTLEELASTYLAEAAEEE